jgi:hypothetical protein
MKPEGMSAGRAGFYAGVCVVVGAGVGFILHRSGVPVAGTVLTGAAAALALGLIIAVVVVITGRS